MIHLMQRNTLKLLLTAAWFLVVLSLSNKFWLPYQFAIVYSAVSVLIVYPRYCDTFEYTKFTSV
jgi:hypothetical protein